MKSYKDQPQLETSKNKQGYIATRSESEAIVANRAGDYVLPEVTLNWWNTTTEKWQTAVLESQTLNVSGTTAPIVNSVDPQNIADSQAESQTDIAYESINNWQILSAILAFIVLLQFYLLVRKGKATSSSTKHSRPTKPSEREAWEKMQVSFKSENHRAIRNDILAWGRAILGDETSISLDKLAAAGNTQALGVAFADLDKHLYREGQKPDTVNLRSLLKELRKTLLKSNKSNSKSTSHLNPLYPN